MDFHRMKRKELQQLCKKHGIPANLKNVEMADRLSALLLTEENPEKVTKRGRSCLKNLEFVGDEDKEVKKVRFSPENQTFLFERTDPRAMRLLARKSRGFVNTGKEVNPVLVAGDSEESVVESDVVIVSKDVDPVEKAVGRSLRRRSVVESEAVLVSESVEEVPVEGGNFKRNVRSRGRKAKEESVEDVGRVEKAVGRSLRRSVVESEAVLVSESAEEVPVEGGNFKRNVRSRGRKAKEESVEVISLLSPCVEKVERGRKGQGLKEVGDVEGVDRPPDKMVDHGANNGRDTRRQLRNREVSVENSEKGKDCEGSNLKTRGGKRKSSVFKGQEIDVVNNIPKKSPEMALVSRKRKPATKKTSTPKQQECKGDKEVAVEEVEKGNDGGDKVLEKIDLMSGGLRRKKKIVEQDGGYKPMQVTRRSARQAGESEVDASVTEQVVEDKGCQSITHLDEDDCEEKGCSLEKPDHISSRLAGPDDSSPASNLSESGKPEVYEQHHATGDSIRMEQIAGKFEEATQFSPSSSQQLYAAYKAMKLWEYKEVKGSIDKAPASTEVTTNKDTSTPFLFQNSGNGEANTGQEISSELPIIADNNSSGNYAFASPTKTEGTSNDTSFSCGGASEPVSSITSKPTVAESTEATNPGEKQQPTSLRGVEVDSSLIQQAVDDNGCHNINNMDEDDWNGRGHIILNPDTVEADHVCSKETVPGGPNPPCSLSESSKPDIDEQCHASGDSTHVEQKAEDYEEATQVSPNSSQQLDAAYNAMKLEDYGEANGSINKASANTEVKTTNNCSTPILFQVIGDGEADLCQEIPLASPAIADDNLRGSYASAPAANTIETLNDTLLNLRQTEPVSPVISKPVYPIPGATEPVSPITSKPTKPESSEATDTGGERPPNLLHELEVDASPAQQVVSDNKCQSVDDMNEYQWKGRGCMENSDIAGTDHIFSKETAPAISSPVRSFSESYRDADEQYLASGVMEQKSENVEDAAQFSPNSSQQSYVKNNTKPAKDVREGNSSVQMAFENAEVSFPTLANEDGSTPLTQTSGHDEADKIRETALEWLPVADDVSQEEIVSTPSIIRGTLNNTSFKSTAEQSCADASAPVIKPTMLEITEANNAGEEQRSDYLHELEVDASLTPQVVDDNGCQFFDNMDEDIWKGHGCSMENPLIAGADYISSKEITPDSSSPACGLSNKSLPGIDVQYHATGDSIPLEQRAEDIEEDCEEPTGSIEKAAENGQPNIQTPIKDYGSTPPLMQNNGDDEADEVQKTPVEMSAVADDNDQKDYVSAPLNITEGAFNGTSFSSMAEENFVDSLELKPVCGVTANTVTPESSEVIYAGDKQSSYFLCELEVIASLTERMSADNGCQSIMDMDEDEHQVADQLVNQGGEGRRCYMENPCIAEAEHLLSHEPAPGSSDSARTLSESSNEEVDEHNLATGVMVEKAEKSEEATQLSPNSSQQLYGVHDTRQVEDYQEAQGSIEKAPENAEENMQSLRNEDGSMPDLMQSSGHGEANKVRETSLEVEGIESTPPSIIMKGTSNSTCFTSMPEQNCVGELSVLFCSVEKGETSCKETPSGLVVCSAEPYVQNSAVEDYMTNSGKIKDMDTEKDPMVSEDNVLALGNYVQKTYIDNTLPSDINSPRNEVSECLSVSGNTMCFKQRSMKAAEHTEENAFICEDSSASPVQMRETESANALHPDKLDFQLGNEDRNAVLNNFFAKIIEKERHEVSHTPDASPLTPQEKSTDRLHDLLDNFVHRPSIGTESGKLQSSVKEHFNFDNESAKSIGSVEKAFESSCKQTAIRGHMSNGEFQEAVERGLAPRSPLFSAVPEEGKDASGDEVREGCLMAVTDTGDRDGFSSDTCISHLEMAGNSVSFARDSGKSTYIDLASGMVCDVTSKVEISRAPTDRSSTCADAGAAATCEIASESPRNKHLNQNPQTDHSSLEAPPLSPSELLELYATDADTGRLDSGELMTTENNQTEIDYMESGGEEVEASSSELEMFDKLISEAFLNDMGYDTDNITDQNMVELASARSVEGHCEADVAEPAENVSLATVESHSFGGNENEVGKIEGVLGQASEVGLSINQSVGNQEDPIDTKENEHHEGEKSEEDVVTHQDTTEHSSSLLENGSRSNLVADADIDIGMAGNSRSGKQNITEEQVYDHRLILIHGTPKKPPLFTHDMKENMLGPKRMQMVNATAVKPVLKRRKALEEI